MAIAQLPPETLVDAIKHAVSSPQTCSSATLRSLQDLLDPGDTSRKEDGTGRETSHTKSLTKLALSKSRRPNTKDAKPRSTIKATVVEILQEEPLELSKVAKVALATEVFNKSLKALTEEGRKKNKDVQGSKGGAIGQKTVPLHAPSETRSFSDIPLQPCSPNRSRKSPPTAKTLRRSRSSSMANSAPGLAALADCAQAALACLRIEQSQQEPQRLQLEQGALILAGKLIGLGLPQHAKREIRRVRRRIQAYLGHEEQSTIRAARATSQENLPEMLVFDSLSMDAAALTLVITLQGHVLRLVASERRSRDAVAISDNLELSKPSSPASLILGGLQSGRLSPEKAALHLQTFSQLVANLCPRSAGDPRTADVSLSELPKVFFTLQCISLQLRCLSWRVAGHKCDLENELWAPFARFLTVFHHQCQFGDLASYDVASTAFSGLKVLVVESKFDSTDQWPATHAPLKVLALMAADCGRVNDAIVYYRRKLECSASNGILPACIIHCKIAALYLQNFDTANMGLLDAELRQAASGLKGLLKGSGQELDELLTEAGKVRKSLLVGLQKIGKMGLPSLQDRLQKLTSDFIFAFVRFLSRYLGHIPTQGDTAKGASESVERSEKAQNIAKATIDSAISACKRSILGEIHSFATVDSVMEDCSVLSAILDSAAPGREGSEQIKTDTRQSIFVNLSNLYWTRYLKQKDSLKGPQLLAVLEKSANLLRFRSPHDQRAGFLGVKFERIALIHIEADQTEEAAIAYANAISSYATYGTLAEAASLAQAQALRLVFNNSIADLANLGRVLASNVRLMAQNTLHEDSRFFDKPDLPLDQRALMLEWQLKAMIEANSCENNFGSFLALARAILSLYREDSYPIRRRRVLARIMTYVSEKSSWLEDQVLDHLPELAMKNTSLPQDLAFDIGLASFAPNLSATLLLSHAFHESQATEEELQRVLAIWTSVVFARDNWDSVEQCLEDPDHFVSQLNSIIDFTEMQGLWMVRLNALRILQRMLEHQPMKDSSSLVICLAQQGTQYDHLGHSSEAGRLFGSARAIATSRDVSFNASLTCDLGYAAYLSNIGNLGKSIEVMDVARSAYHDKALTGRQPRSTRNSREKLWIDVSVAQAALIASTILAEKGDLPGAILNAKFCVGLGSRIWSALEKLAERTRSASPRHNGNIDVEAVTEGLSKLMTSDPLPHSSYHACQGAMFWPHVNWRISGLLNISQLSAGNGLFQDAIYYGERALAVADAVGSTAMRMMCQAVLGHQWACAGKLETAQALLQAASSLQERLDVNVETVVTTRYLASLRRLQGNSAEATKATLSAQQMLSEISRFKLVPSVADSEAGMVTTSSNVRLDTSSDPQNATRARRPKATGRGKKAKLASNPAPVSTKSLPESNPLLRLLGDLQQDEALDLLASSEREEASTLRGNCETLPSNVHGRLRAQFASFKQSISTSLKALSAHPVFCVLLESTVSFPSQLNAGPGVAWRTPSKNPKPCNNSVSRPKNELRKGSKRTTLKTAKQDQFTKMMTEAKQLHDWIHTSCSRLGSTAATHESTKLLTRYEMLLSVLTTEPHRSPLEVVHFSELGRMLAMCREKLFIIADRQLANASVKRGWPDLRNEPAADLSVTQTLTDSSGFQKEYIDILPQSWTVISMSLSEDRSELLMSKLQSGHTPFLIRLPIRRCSPDDGMSDFGFVQAKEELLEIIRLANSSAHDASNRIDQAGKKDWWAQRELLDQRLRDLLLNIESSWLGGFRSFFSTPASQPNALACFNQAFLDTLDSHLPSRQKGRTNQELRITLHPRVLDLFVGLPHPDEADLDDSVADLLYFVVDVLQFYGERNAYDEIDFDMMVVEVLDALRHYHKVAKESPHVGPANHTILVLEKELHGFPWESLPCLEGIPISRMPSLECLRQRILRMQEESSAAEGLYVDRSDGSYILNPSGDLKTTQETFAEPLRASLDSWTSIEAREPTEDECMIALRARDLFLYFGHGSGAQYIRGRTLKRLERCAVTFLMGCSSGTVTEAGDFEPYGTPINYMHAGCPALVATLWDVTDKDIDRFAMASLQSWGLLDGQSDKADVKGRKPVKLRGKGRKPRLPLARSAPEIRDVSLDEAVAQAREACVLKYLNGAAPVIYGIPVYLK